MSKLETKESFLTITSPYWTIQKMGYILITLLLISAIFGLTGNGFFSINKTTKDGTHLTISYDLVMRAHADNLITFFIDPKVTENLRDKNLNLITSRKNFENTVIKNILPKPTKETLQNNELIYTFELDKSNLPLMIQFRIEPHKAGMLYSAFHLDKLPPIHFTQIILP